jgi:hypothetical protein
MVDTDNWEKLNTVSAAATIHTVYIGFFLYQMKKAGNDWHSARMI